MWPFFVICICIILNGLLAATELAFVSVSRSRLKRMVQEGSRSAQIVLDLRDNPEKTLSVLQLGITFIGIVAAAVGGIAMDSWIGQWLQETFQLSVTLSEVVAIVIFVIPYTYLNVVLSELLPKSLALRNPQKVILFMGPWVIKLGRILWPIVFLLEKATKAGVHFFSIWVKHEEEVKEELVPVGRLVRPYMLNLAKVERQTVFDIMIPWNEVDTLDIGLSKEDVKALILKTGHTRLPVVENGVAIGVLLSKKFLVAESKGDEQWQTLITQILRVESKETLVHALKAMQAERSHLSIVMDKGSCIGAVTIEDILEEVVGEIYDEDDPRF